MTSIYRNTLITILSSLLLSLSTLIYAGSPVWTFTPLTATSLSVPGNGTALVQYLVTNQAAQSFSLVMTPITGITQITTGVGICSNPFTLPSRGSSCTLSLQVNGSQLTHSITDGPIVCEQGSSLQCYKPSPSNILNINVGANVYTVGGSVTGLTGTVTLLNNGTNSTPISTDGSFTFSTPFVEGRPYAVTVGTQPVNQTCNVSHGTGTVGGSNITDVGVSCVTNTTTLTTSISNLALSVYGHTEYGVAGTPPSGAARVITITNTGNYPAENLEVTAPTWPLGTIPTTSATNCVSPLAAGSTCTITVTPGDTATSDGTNPCSTTGTAPVAGVVQVTADNAGTVSTNVVVLDYGCIYQGGHVYAFDDTAAIFGSVGGKVAATSNQAAPNPYGIPWDSSSGCLNGFPYNNCYTTNAYSNSNGTNVAGGNTYVIYHTLTGTYDELATSYAAGLCTSSISGYSDWYMPAICEMGFDRTGAGTGCGTSGTPTLQNMQSNLVNFNNLNLLAGFYWSSTDYSGDPQTSAWGEYFASGGSSIQYSYYKYNSFGVRCSRVLTP